MTRTVVDTTRTVVDTEQLTSEADVDRDEHAPAPVVGSTVPLPEFVRSSLVHTDDGDVAVYERPAAAALRLIASVLLGLVPAAALALDITSVATGLGGSNSLNSLTNSGNNRMQVASSASVVTSPSGPVGSTSTSCTSRM